MKDNSITYKLERWSIRNIIVEKLRNCLIKNSKPSPCVLDITTSVNRNSIEITVSDDITLEELSALDKLVKSTESILYDKLKEQT